MRALNRKDFEYVIVKGRGRFSRAAYACVITQSTAHPDDRAIYHIETFYGNNGVETRAEARRYGGAICRGERGVGRYRDQALPSIFSSAGLPKPEKQIALR